MGIGGVMTKEASTMSKKILIAAIAYNLKKT
jgi:hypothetical protein